MEKVTSINGRKCRSRKSKERTTRTKLLDDMVYKQKESGEI